MEERIAPGGVVALIRCIAALDDMQLERDNLAGFSIVVLLTVGPFRYADIHPADP